MKKIIFTLAITITCLTLTACNKPKEKSAMPISSTAASVSKTSSSSKTTTTSTTMTKEETTEEILDFEKIKAGDFSQLAGSWEQLGMAVKGETTNFTPSTSETLTVSKDTISGAGVSLKDGYLHDNNGDYPAHFSEEDGTLRASIPNEIHTSINWSITFYPENVENSYTLDGTPISSDTPLIHIWTSNNGYTTIYKKITDEKISPIKEETPTENTESTSLNLDALSQGDFSSLVGTWTNQTTGEIYQVTSEIETQPEGMNLSIEKGAVIANAKRDGYNLVVSADKITSGYIIGSIGSFNPTVIASPFAPLAIVPKGVQISPQDDSDSTKERLIVGGGQGGYANSAFYRD